MILRHKQRGALETFADPDHQYFKAHSSVISAGLGASATVANVGTGGVYSGLCLGSEAIV